MSDGGWIRIRRWRPFGAEVRLHWTLVAVGACALAAAAANPLTVAFVLCAYYLTLVTHEAGHAAMARRLGYRVFSLEFGLFHGRCIFGGEEIAPRDLFLATLAGPAAQLFLAGIVLALGQVPAIRDFDPFGPVYVFAGFFGVAWAVLNLVPVRGFDGDIVWRALRQYLRRRSPPPRSRDRRPPPR